MANAALLTDMAGPSAQLCAVVKANGYGHGATTAARAALRGGASWLAVATLEEALEIAEIAARRGAHGEGVPVLILAELSPEAAVHAARTAPDFVRFTIGSVAGIEALAAAEVTRRVHLKVDTGMHRMGAIPEELPRVAAALRRAPTLLFEAAYTHFADADNLTGDTQNGGFTAQQLRRFGAARATLREHGLPPPVVHAANSAGLLAHPESHMDLVRVGIALYGVPPAPSLTQTATAIGLQPALSVVSAVSAVRTVDPGESVSYGRHWHASEPTRVATVPMGYADGMRRHSGPAGVEVLIRGKRCPVVGVVTMDQFMAALPQSLETEVNVGDEVVILGRQGPHQITATEIAERLGTIAYEVLTGLSSRVPRTPA